MKLLLMLVASAPLFAAEPTLVWSDEFNTPGRPDPAKWTYEQGMIRNREAQFYRPENARVENGMLIIEARRERHEKAEYTSASVTTEGKAEWKYGRIEVRAKLPGGRGTWPAIWMLGINRRTAGWPRCGEIDIMENVGYEPNVIHANIHTAAYNHVKKTNKGAKINVPAPSQDFHVYSVDWTAETMDFFVDGKKYFSFANEKKGEEVWPFDQPFYLILNLAIGGDWGGRQGIDESAFPRRMEVDYVRVYRLN